MRLMLQGRASGILFMGLFGAAWASQAAAKLPMSYTAVIYAVAVAVAGALVWVSFRFRTLARAQPEPSAEEVAVAARGEKRFYWVLAAEGVALFVAGNVLINLHQLDYLGAVVALIVGLHFFPLRHVFRLPVYDVTGALMSLVGIVAMGALATGHDLGADHAWDVVTGLACALILWGTCAAVILRVRRLMAETSGATRSAG
jgi:hypothetical protein